MELIDQNKKYLEQKETEDIDESDFESLQAVKHSMFEIAEACIDIASHIVASEGFDKPDDYSGFFPVLAQNKVIDKDLADRMADMARFRNFLVHRYGEVEPEKLEQFITEDLEDIEAFTSQIYEFIEKN